MSNSGLPGALLARWKRLLFAFHDVPNRMHVAGQ
jgi:hypothetical protein